MKLRLALATATCLSLPLLAQAQPVTGPYVSLGAGTSIMYPTNVNFEDEGVSGKYQFRPSYAGVAGIGYGFGDGFRIELGGNYYRNTAHAADIDGGEHLRATGGENKFGAMVNVLYDIPVGLPVFPYVGAGAGYEGVHYDSDLSINAGSGVNIKTDGTEGSFAYDVIAGVAYPLPMVPGLSLTAEYRFMQLVQSRGYYSFAEGPGFNEPFSKAKIGQESSHTFLFGVRYQLFNPPPPAPPPAAAPMVAAAPAPTPAKTYLVFFDWDKYNLTPRAMNIIAQAASDSKTAQTTTINVSGYTDTSGTAKYNMGLSWRRAKAVAAQLVTDGVPASEIQAQGFGDTHLLVPTGPGVREPQNRRVEIVLK